MRDKRQKVNKWFEARIQVGMLFSLTDYMINIHQAVLFVIEAALGDSDCETARWDSLQLVLEVRLNVRIITNTFHKTLKLKFTGFTKH